MQDLELKGLIDQLKSNEKVIELVKVMQPLDIVVVISRDLGLHREKAKTITMDLIKHTKTAETEGMVARGIETNKQYPVPASSRKDQDPNLESEEKIKEDAGNYVNSLPTYSVNRNQFPPDPKQKTDDWPYDSMTVAAMAPRSKGRRRPLMQGAFDPNMDKNQPGVSGKGVQSKSAPHSRTNSTSSSGRSWSKQGTPGWSSSPPGREFNLPNDRPPDELPDDLDIMKPSPVGSSIPQFSQGGNPGSGTSRRMGFRRR
jgi:hypothetical protein